LYSPQRRLAPRVGRGINALKGSFSIGSDVIPGKVRGKGEEGEKLEKRREEDGDMTVGMYWRKRETDAG